MIFKRKKVSQRRQQVKNSISTERITRLSKITNSSLPLAILQLLLFVLCAILLLGVNSFREQFMTPGTAMFKPFWQFVSNSMIVILVSFAAALYVYNYEPRLISRPIRLMIFLIMFLVMLFLAKLGSLYPQWVYMATGTAITTAIVLTIVYDQRFAINISMLYCILACFAVSSVPTIELFLTMMAGVITCCFSLREIRTRMKLIEVSMYASIVVFLTAASLGMIQDMPLMKVSSNAGSAALVTIAVGVIIQGFLPMIERIFGIATSMTLMDWSDANQPLLKKLAMEAPGTFSHSLLIGTIAEAAAESIHANGLLCRVGAYYHDIGKINKPPYFVENQMGSASRHEQLSPTMSQLVIVGHVKDGIEIAREFGMPSVLRQFIETHHGTTLIEYFYNEAKKQAQKPGSVLESEFRYPGPKPKTKEAAIVMLADSSESATRSLPEITPTRIEAVVHNIAMKRLQDGQFDECDLTLKELSRIESTLSKSLAAHHHGRIAYPTPADQPPPKPENNGASGNNQNRDNQDQQVQQ